MRCSRRSKRSLIAWNCRDSMAARRSSFSSKLDSRRAIAASSCSNRVRVSWSMPPRCTRGRGGAIAGWATRRVVGTGRLPRRRRPSRVLGLRADVVCPRAPSSPGGNHPPVPMQTALIGRSRREPIAWHPRYMLRANRNRRGSPCSGTDMRPDSGTHNLHPEPRTMESPRYIKTPILSLLLIALAGGEIAAQDAPAQREAALATLPEGEPAWLRYPAISPDGKTIVFTYQGDLWRVPAEGGEAVRLTTHPAHDYRPVWSPDGEYIAFASDRYGNFQIYIMPARGGEPRRLTFHSANETPYAFTPDGKYVIFGAARLDDAANRQFPSNALPELYMVPVTGGRVVQLTTLPAEDVS